MEQNVGGGLLLASRMPGSAIHRWLWGALPVFFASCLVVTSVGTMTAPAKE
jgi:hypothetical protein